MRKSTVLSLLVSGMALSAFARVEPSALFTDHAVLLRSSDTPVFGFAEPGEKVSVALGAASASAVADAHGAWLVRLDLRDAPKTPQTLVMNDAIARDMLVGEVWLCSGQSNMAFTLGGADDAEGENAFANQEIRCFNVDVRCLLAPNLRISGRWLRDVPKEKLAFSAIGYHFAKRLQAGLGVPVGIVNSSVGASTLEAWCDPDALSAFPEGKRCLDGQIAFMDGYRDYERRCQEALRTWERKWGRADRLHEAAPTNGWRALTQSERDSFRHGPGAIWFRRKMAPKPKGLVVSRKRFIERQWRFDDSAAEFYFNGRRLTLSYPESPMEKNTELYVVPSSETAKGGMLEVRFFNARGIPDVLHYLRSDKLAFSTDDWSIAEEFNLPALSPMAAKDVPPPQRFCLSQHYPSALHNGMIAGLVPMGLSGVTWYQGESNTTRVEAGSGPEAYHPLFSSFIHAWRKIFNKPELPFVWCQLASLGPKVTDANEGTTDAWVALRAAQQRTLKLPRTGQVVLVDAGEQGDIHPRDKRTPGFRMADWALNRVYGRSGIPDRGPNVKDVCFADGRATVRFADCGRGLVVRDLGETYVIRSKSGTLGKVKRNSPAADVEGFALAGADGVWYWADLATMSGDAVVVSSGAVPRPVAVRYGWSKNPYVNLYNADGLPAEPFEWNFVRVGTYNIRYSEKRDDETGNGWEDRRADLVSLFSRLNLDVAGFQEVLPHQYEYLRSACAGWSFVGDHRGADRQSDEASPIAFRTARLKLVDSGTFWLSETPDVPGVKSWGACWPRICTWAVLEDRVNGRRFCFANTHTDNVSEKAREEGVKLIVRRMRDYAGGLPIVLVGDHNNQENESPSRYLAQVMDNALYKSETSPSGPWRTWNGWRELENEVTCVEALQLPLAIRNVGWEDKAASGESAAFRARSSGPRIDYIWVPRDARVRNYTTHADLRPGCSHYPSDHFPVTAEVAF